MLSEFCQTNKGNNHLGNTDIFARIPIYKDDSTLADTTMVKWEDSNDLYSIHIQNHQLSNVRFKITDDKHHTDTQPFSPPQIMGHTITHTNNNHDLTIPMTSPSFQSMINYQQDKPNLQIMLRNLD